MRLETDMWHRKPVESCFFGGLTSFELLILADMAAPRQRPHVGPPSGTSTDLRTSARAEAGQAMYQSMASQVGRSVGSVWAPESEPEPGAVGRAQSQSHPSPTGAGATRWSRTLHPPSRRMYIWCIAWKKHKYS